MHHMYSPRVGRFVPVLMLPEFHFSLFNFIIVISKSKDKQLKSFDFNNNWKVVKPLLQERTRKKIQVLQGCGKDELLKVMDYGSLPHFCKKQDSKSSRHSAVASITENCFSFNHAFHQQLYNHVKQQANSAESTPLMRQESFYVDIPEPDPDDAKIAKTIEVEFHKLENQNNGNIEVEFHKMEIQKKGFTSSRNGVAVNGRH